MNTQPNTKTALLIAGVTASGKSAFAITQAKKLNGVIVNADSMQVYSNLRILTARPSAEDEADVPHRLYGRVAAPEEFSVAAWLSQLKIALDEIWQEGKTPIIVGGTGLYFMALEKGLAEIPDISAYIREKWRRFDGDLYQALQERDAASAERLQPTDLQRLRRALEVLESTGTPLHQWQAEAESNSLLQGVECEKIVLNLPRDAAYNRANLRFQQMLNAGAIDEVKSLGELPAKHSLLKAIGVPQLQRFIAGQISIELAAAEAQQSTRHYIKRQLTWFKKFMADWRWIEP